MRTIVGSIAAAGALALAQPCAAASLERKAEIDALILVVGGGGDGDDLEEAVGRAGLRFSADVLFDNQIELGGGIELAAESDHPGRAPRGGTIGTCPAAAPPGCPPAVRGYVSGLTLAPDDRDEDARASIEAAYVYVRGGWGEASLGREPGVAARFSLPLPTLIRGAGVVDPSLEPLGPGAVFVRNDISGRSFKVSAVSQRLLGVAVGASYTPQAEHQGLDQGYARGPVPVYEPENTAEAGLSYVDTFGNGLEVGLSATAARAEAASRPELFDEMTSYGATATLGRGGFSAGVSWLRNDNGWRAEDAPYEAFAGAASYEAGGWRIAVEAGLAEDDLVRADVHSVAIGAARTVAEGTEIAIQAKRRLRNSRQWSELSTGEQENEARGLFFSVYIRR